MNWDNFFSRGNGILFHTGKFPDVLKVTRIIPVFKKGDRENPCNYRPITFLNLASKNINPHMMPDRRYNNDIKRLLIY